MHKQDARQELIKWCEVILERLDEPPTAQSQDWWDNVWSLTHKLQDAIDQVDEDGFRSNWPAALILKSSQSCSHESPLFAPPKVNGKERVMLWWHDPLQAPDKPGGVATLYYADDLNLFEDKERQMWDRHGRVRTMPATKDTFRVAIKRWLAAARRLSELKPYPYRVDQWEDGLPGVEAAVCDIERFENWFTDHKDQILREKTEWKTIHMLRTCQMNAFKLAKHLKAASQLNELLNETDQIANWLNRVAHGDFDTADYLAAACKSQIQHFRSIIPNPRTPQLQIEANINENQNDDQKPTWSADHRTLSFDGKIARQFSPQTGNNVLNIISTFQECNWQSRIDDPLSPPDAEKTKLALRTINARLSGLRFSKDGDGIKWELLPK